MTPNWSFNRSTNGMAPGSRCARCLSSAARAKRHAVVARLNLLLQGHPRDVKKPLLAGLPETRLSSIQTIQSTHTKPAADMGKKVRSAKLQPVFAATVCAAGSDERHVREIAAQIDSEKHLRHGHLLAARCRGLSFCRPVVRAGQARRLLAQASVLGATRRNFPFIR